MKNYIETPRVSEILFEEFMAPYGLSAYRLAQEIHVPVSRIQDILHNRRKITADTSIRLAKFLAYLTDIFLIFRMILILEIRKCRSWMNLIIFQLISTPKCDKWI